jgi:hypothetical protein
VTDRERAELIFKTVREELRGERRRVIEKLYARKRRKREMEALAIGARSGAEGRARARAGAGAGRAGRHSLRAGPMDLPSPAEDPLRKAELELKLAQADAAKAEAERIPALSGLARNYPAFVGQDFVAGRGSGRRWHVRVRTGSSWASSRSVS